MKQLFILIALLSCAFGSLQAAERDSLRNRLIELEGAPPAERGQVCYQIGRTYASTYDYDSAITCYQHALELGREGQDLDLIHKALFIIGYTHYATYDYSEALAYFHQALEEVAEVRDDDSLRAVVYDWISLQYLYSGAYGEAIRHQLQSISIREALQDSAGLAESYYSMGDILDHQRKYRESQDYFQKCIRLAERFDQTHLVFGAYGSIGALHIEAERWDSAYWYSRKAHRIAIEEDLEYGIAYTNSSLGECYLHYGQFDSAREAFTTALELARRMGEASEIAYSLAGLGQVTQKTNGRDHALELYSEAVRVSVEFELDDVREDIFEKLVGSYVEWGMYDSAYSYQKQLADLRDTLFQKRNESTVSTLEARYDILQKEAAQKEAILLKDQQIRRMTVWGGIVVLVLIIAIIAMLVNTLRTHQRNNALLEAHNVKISEQNVDLKQFAYSTSHDLKQPLRTIGNFSSLIQKRLGDPDDRETGQYFDFINQAVSDMSSLLTNLLSYSQLDDKRRSYEDLCLNEVFHSVTNNLNVLIREKEANILVEELPAVEANREHMMQLFQNLVNNALKFNDKDYPEVMVSFEKQGDQYRFSVKDNGVGIDAAHTERVFGLFERVGDTDRFGGSGMGLAISQRIVKHYRGQIWVESVPGKGSTFHFTLPARIAAAA